MMKKIFALIFSLVVVKCSFSQTYPLQQNLGSDSTIVISKGALQSRLIPIVVSDTTAANAQRMKNYPGAQLYTTNGNFYIRNSNATKWVLVSSGSSGPVNIYNSDGTLTGNRVLTGAGNSILFNGVSGFGVNKAPDSVFTVDGGIHATGGLRLDNLASSPGTKSLRINSQGQVTIADTTISGGTVTQVNTNNATGITGGPITTSGTLAIDTNLISTRAWRQKGVDSLQANINQKLNISDTAAMLTNYVNNVNYGLSKVGKVVSVDSATLSNYYLRRKDSLTTTNPLGYVTRKVLADTASSIRSAIKAGTVTSVALTMPTAFNVAGSPITTSGTFAVTGAGLASQYIRGDGTLANFPGGGGGGGASVSYYLNGSVNQGTFGGNTYYQMNKTPVLGAGTNFTINANGYIAQFITNAGDPALLNIPAGNWNFELFFSASSGGGTPSYYVELYKYDGTTFTLIASGSSNPDVIINSAVDAYFSALPVPQTTLTLTDRLAVRIYVAHAGRTITLHTEDNNLCQVITTFTTGITAINSLTAQVQYLTTGTSGTDFNISSLTDTHTFNLPVASATNTGKLSSANWTTFNNKIGPSDTASMLAPYLRKADTTAMLTNYLNNVGYGLSRAGKIVSADSATLSNYYLRRKDSLTSTNLLGYVTRKVLADTAAAIRSADAGGTVTSVATNNGTGITGGTITTSGTLAIDTLLISTRAWRQKGIDSVAAVANTKIGGSGTINRVSKFTASGTIGNSSIADSSASVAMTIRGNGNVGIGVTVPDSMFTVSQGALFQRGVRMSGLPSAPGTKALRIDANGTISIADTTTGGGGGSIGGSGTTNYVPKFTASTTLGNSLMFDTGTGIAIGNGQSSATPQLGLIEGTDGSGTNIAGAEFRIQGGQGTGTGAGGPITFYTSAAGTSGSTLNSATERMRIDANGNLGINNTPQSWGIAYRTIQIGQRGALWAHTSAGSTYLSENIWDDGSASKYVVTGAAAGYQMASGAHYWYQAASGTAGTNISLTTSMFLNTSNNLGIGTTTIGSRLQVNGNAAIGYSASTAAPTNGLAVAGNVAVGTNSADNTYSGITINGSNPSLRIKATTATAWTWLEFANSSAVNNFSLGVNQTQPQFVIKAGAGLDNANFTMNSSGAIFIGNGETASSPSTGIISGTGGTGTNIAGAEFRIRGGASTGSAAGGPITFYTSAAGTAGTGVNAATERMRILGNGNVGIGITNPDQILVVSSTQPILKVSATTNTNFASLVLNTKNASSVTLEGGIYYFPTASPYMLISGDNSGNHLIVTSTGNIGLNTTTIGSRLQVNGNAAIGYSASTAAPTNGLIVAGNTIIGGATTSAFLQVKGSGTTSSTYQIYTNNSTSSTFFYVRDDGVVAATNVSANSGSYGSGTGTQTSLTAFGGSGNLQMRFTSGSTDASIYNGSGGGIKIETLSGANGIYLNGSGSTGFGTTTVGSTIQVNGGAAIGYSASTAAPTNGLAVSGLVGIATTTPKSYTAMTVNGQLLTLNNLLVNAGNTIKLNAYYNSATVTDKAVSAGFAGDYFLNNSTGSLLFRSSATSFAADADVTLVNRMEITSSGETKLTPSANTAMLSTTGAYSLTGANAQSLIDLAGTWNTTGNPTALKLNITNTASGASAYLMDLQVGGVTQFRVTKGGAIQTVGGVPWKLNGSVVTLGGSNLQGISVDVNGTTYYLVTGYLPEPEPDPSAAPASGPSGNYKTYNKPTPTRSVQDSKIAALEKELAELKEMIKSIKK